MSYLFIKKPDPENRYDITQVTIEMVAEDASLDQVVDTLTRFLRACGYVFDGELVIQPPDSD